MKRKTTLLDSVREKLELSVVYPHAPEKVWRALTDPRSLEKWMLPNDFRAEVGHRFHFQDRNRRIACEVVALDDHRRIAYTWRDGSDEPLSVVTWTLEAVEAGTRVSVEHASVSVASAVGAKMFWSGRFSGLSGVLRLTPRVRQTKMGRDNGVPTLRPLLASSPKGRRAHFGNRLRSLSKTSRIET